MAGDHVVGHFSSNVTAQVLRRAGREVASWPLWKRTTEVQIEFDRLGRGPTRVVRTIGLGLPTGPADWRFREDGY